MMIITNTIKIIIMDRWPNGAFKEVIYNWSKNKTVFQVFMEINTCFTKVDFMQYTVMEREQIVDDTALIIPASIHGKSVKARNEERQNRKFQRQENRKNSIIKIENEIKQLETECGFETLSKTWKE